MIAELLGTGEQNATTGTELASYFGFQTKDVRAVVMRERRAGKPICATTKAGYYLASSDADIINYCKRLEHRENEIRRTRNALLKLVESQSSNEEGATKHE